MFDLPEDSVSASVDTEKISQLMQSLDVFINIRHKPKQSTLSVIIKGIERNAGNIYEARKQLLGLDEPRVHAEIPATYHIPNAGSIFQGNSNNDVSKCHAKGKRRGDIINRLHVAFSPSCQLSQSTYDSETISQRYNLKLITFSLDSSIILYRFSKNACFYYCKINLINR